MQKFGLYPNRSSHNTAIELEIAREQASALGRAGRKLRLSLESYQDRCNENLTEQEDRLLIKEISANVWALLLQREFLGFTEGNIDWVRAHYSIPKAAIEHLGRS